MTDALSAIDTVAARSLDDIEARWAILTEQAAARSRLAAELLPANKTALFDALSVAGIVAVVVVFDGYGDSGQIESADARDAHGAVSLPEGEIMLAEPLYDGSASEAASLPIAEVIEKLAYDFLEEVAAGWENNDGAYGEFTFDVAARTIGLDYNERMTTSENHSYGW